jgi:hypothetical protein
VWLPGGSFVLEPATAPVQHRVLDFNGDLKAAFSTATGVELSYQSGSRALAALNGRVKRMFVDGLEQTPAMITDRVLRLPRGQHLVSIEFEERQP